MGPFNFHDPQEDELRQRAALARSQGWSNDEIQRSMAMERMMSRSAAPQAQAAPAEQTDDGGGLLGAALNFVPFGNIARKAFTGHGGEITAGEVAMEALLSTPWGRALKGLSSVAKGLTGAGSKGARTATAARRADKAQDVTSKGVAAEGSVESLMPSGASAAVKPSLLESVNRKGQQLEARAGGFNVGMKQTGKDAVGVKKSEEVSGWLKAKGVKGGSAVERLRAVEAVQDAASAGIDSVLATRNVSIAKTDLNRVSKEFLDEVGRLPGLGDGDLRSAIDISNSLDQVTDARSLVEFKRNLDKSISYVKSPDAASAVKQQLSEAVRRKVVKLLDEKVPELKPYNSDYSKAREAGSFLASSARSPQGVSLPGMNRSFFGPQVQTAQSKAGTGMQSFAGDSLSARLVREGGAQAGKRVVADTLGMRQGEQPPEQQPTDLSQSMPGQTIQPDLLSTMQQSPQQPQENPVQQAFERDFIETGGKNFDLLEQMYGNFDDRNQGGEMSEDEAKVSTAGSAIDQLEQLLTAAGGGQGLPGYLARAGAQLKGPNPEIETLDKVRRSAAVSIARAMGETGPLSNQDIEMYASMLPDITDSPEGARQTFQAIRQRLNSTQYGGNGGSGASDLLTRMGY